MLYTLELSTFKVDVITSSMLAIAIRGAFAKPNSLLRWHSLNAATTAPTSPEVKRLGPICAENPLAFPLDEL